MKLDAPKEGKWDIYIYKHTIKPVLTSQKGEAQNLAA